MVEVSAPEKPHGTALGGGGGGGGRGETKLFATRNFMVISRADRSETAERVAFWFCFFLGAF